MFLSFQSQFSKGPLRKKTNMFFKYCMIDFFPPMTWVTKTLHPPLLAGFMVRVKPSCNNQGFLTLKKKKSEFFCFDYFGFLNHPKRTSDLQVKAPACILTLLSLLSSALINLRSQFLFFIFAKPKKTKKQTIIACGLPAKHRRFPSGRRRQSLSSRLVFFCAWVCLASTGADSQR